MSQVIWYSLILFHSAVRPFSADSSNSDTDTDLITWTTRVEGALEYEYENVDLRQSSFLAVCLAVQFDGSSGTDGHILLDGTSGTR